MRKAVMGLVLASAMVVPVPAPADDASPNDEEDIALLERFAAIVDDNRSNCDKMAEELTRFFDANMQKLAAARDREKKRSDEEKKRYQEKYGARAGAAQTKIKTGVTACAKNSAALAAFKRFPK
jgi:hypothetical protein